MSSPPAAPRTPPLRQRRTPPRPRRVHPVALVLLAACGAAVVWLAVRAHAQNHVTVAFVSQLGPVPPLELTFFPDQLAFAAPSPPPPLGELRLDGDASIAVGRDLVPERAVMRYRGPGIGTGYAHVRIGEPLPDLTLRAPVAFAGRVGEPISFWCYGWRCAGLRPVAGAEVIVMGGGEHGVPLAVAATDADGRFVVEGVDGALDGLGLRVRAQGFALAHQDLRLSGGDGYPVVALARARPISGRVLVPAGIDPSRLRVLARGLPGVQAVPTADGQFVLDHVAPALSPRLVLDGLPGTWTHATARADATGGVTIEVVRAAIVRGRVLDATGAPLAQALVWSGEQDAVRTGGDGRYELLRQLPGAVTIEAQWEPPGRARRAPFDGRRAIVLEPGREHAGVDVVLDTNQAR